MKMNNPKQLSQNQTSNQNQQLSSKSSENDIIEDTKIFIKLVSKGGNYQPSDRIFFFDENRESLFNQQNNTTCNDNSSMYKYDYIFSDYDNTLLMSNTIDSILSALIENEKNITFITLGESNLGTTKFLFGPSHGNLLNSNSFFNYSIQTILQTMVNNFKYDNVLIEIYKIANEKFTVDYREILLESSNSIIDNINSHIKSGHKNGMFSSSMLTNEIIEEAGHVIIRLKFYRFISEADNTKSQREIEIIRTISFVDIAGFSDDFLQLVKSNRNITAKEDPKNYSMYCFKNFIESIANKDLIKFSDISSTLTDILTEIFTVQNMFTFFFGFISEYKQDVLKSQLTLDLLNKCKLFNNNVFYHYLQEMEISISQLGNRAVKEEFQILDLIFSELLFYIEKTFKKLDSFYKEIKDLNQQSKFYYLYNWLTNNHYSYDNNSKISDIFDYVFVYFKTKARWRSLLKAKNEILKLTESLKNEMKEQPIQVLPTDNVSNISIKDELQNLKEKKEDNNFNQQIISLCNQFSNENVKYAEESEISEYLKKSKSKNLFENEVSFSMNNEVPKDFSSSFISNYQRKNNNKNKSQRKSLETNFSQKIFMNIQKSMKETFKGIFNRFTEEPKCISCTAVKNSKESLVSNDKLINEYKTLRVLQTRISLDKISAIEKEGHESLSEIDSEEIKLNLHFNNSNILNKKKTSEKDINQRINQLNTKIDEFKLKHNSSNEKNNQGKVKNITSYQN